MSRIAKWKLEKVKVKVVFRLQFHATHIPQTGWDKLFISFIPADSGKVTAKTSKSNVRNGTCKWGDAIYETTRLLQDIKTKQYDGKLYKLAVAMGSSRSSLLGEANINLADYADASKPSTVALPLHGCNYGTVLHVTIQLLTSKTGFREFEQQREHRERGLHMATNSHDEPVEQLSTSSNTRNDQIDKANSRVRFKSEARDLPSLEEEVELNEDYADSAAGIDDSSNTSESFYAEKHDSSTHEIDSLKSATSGDLGGHSLGQSPTEKGDPSDHQLLTQRNSDWVHGWSSDYSMDNELATASEENSRLRGSLELAESSVIELKIEVSSLQSHADELGAETQKFSQLLAAEIASGEELEKEIFVLKSECSKFKDDFEHLKHSKINSSIEGESVQRNQLHLFQGLQIKWLQGLLILEDKVREVQKKTCLQYHNRDIDSLNPDFEALQLLLQDLKQGTKQTMSLLTLQLGEQAIVSETAVIIAQKPEQFVSGNRFEGTDADQYYYEDIVHGLRKHGQVTQDHEPTVATIALEEKNSELQQELEESKTERDSLARKMDQMECYYEALIQELEENQKHMLGELQNLRNEHSTCLYAISSCKSQMEKAHEDMNEQLMTFSEERHRLDSLNKELERRAITSETALERARWNYSIAVDQLQKDLQLLSLQVLSMFETSENLVRKAFVDSSESCFQEHLEENSEAINSCLHEEYTSFLQKQHKTKARENKVKFSESQKIEQALASDKVVSFPNFMAQREIGDVHSDLVVEAGKNFDVSDSLICQKSDIDCINSKCNLHSADSDTRHLECQHHNAEQKDQFSGGEILLGDLRGFHHLQEELYQKFEHELYEVHAANVHLDVFSKALHETLHEASGGIKQMKQELDWLSQQLAHSIESNEFLTVRLQVALDDVNTLKESEAHCIAKCNELALQNQVLEEKFQSVFNENCFLNQKVQEYEPMVLECKNIESMYEACTAEKIELLNLLKRETLETCSLQNVVSSLNEDLNSLKEDFDKQSVVKNKLEKTVLTVREKLGALWSTVIALDEEINEPSLCFPLQQEMEEKDFISSISHLEELLLKAYEKILQLTQGVKDVEEQRGFAQLSLIGKESESLFLKKKYESDVHNMATKIDTSNALVEKLQLELENISSKLMISHEAEERYAEESKEISSRLAVLEVELQNATSDNKDLAQKILDLEGVNEELERTKQTALSSMQEKQELMMSLQAGNEESMYLEKELCGIKEALQSTRDELHSERSLRFQLEGVVTDLSCQLNVKNDLILSFAKEKAELVHLKQLVSDLELEKNKICNLLLHSEECLRKANESTSSLHAEVTDLQTHLVMLQEYVLAADIELICTRSQLQRRMQELVQQLESLDRCYRELHLKHLDVLTTLNGCISGEAQYVEENARLLTVLDSLRSEMEATVTEKNNLVDRNNCFLAELELYKTKAEISVQNKHLNELEREKLKHILLSCEEAIDNLRSSRDEHEITVIVLRAKLDEQLNQILLLEEYANELTMLRNHNNELARRLSEQTLKTEEFKNLSAHLKELKDKADAACLLAREKRETEAPPTAVQESLRIAFIREQCETKLQELRNQLFISQKHGEEMLFKLQDALDEVENRKRSEASHKRKNEELSLKILDLESELQMVLADKREKVKACDEMKAELECSLISLDCCKEEKQKLEDSLQECIEERTKASIELSVIKEQLESSRSPTDIRVEGNLKPCTPESISINNLALEDALCEEQNGCLVPMQDSLTSKTVVEISNQAVMHQEDLRQLALINKNFAVQSLKTSMGHLHEELEKMKNENLASLPQDANYFDPAFQGLQRDVLQLNKANEQLSSIFPSFNEFSCSGNALDRVLALEIELAEALQAKKKSNFHFQSSFLKQHNDEEAVFQSFRDINELIKDMLELKGRYVAVETELKEMHDRYSQLSLHFAEVEGERQKLVMTLKNSRTPKKSSSLHRSTSTTLEDPS